MPVPCFHLSKCPVACLYLHSNIRRWILPSASWKDPCFLSLWWTLSAIQMVKPVLYLDDKNCLLYSEACPLARWWELSPFHVEVCLIQILRPVPNTVRPVHKSDSESCPIPRKWDLSYPDGETCPYSNCETRPLSRWWDMSLLQTARPVPYPDGETLSAIQIVRPVPCPDGENCLSFGWWDLSVIQMVRHVPYPDCETLSPVY
jgi:hypothetical protein